MLVLSVKDRDVIVVEQGKVLIKVRIARRKVRLCFDAPGVQVDRLKVHEAKQHARQPRSRT